MRAAGSETSDEELEAWSLRQNAVEKRMALLPAHTPAGLRAKLAALADIHDGALPGAEDLTFGTAPTTIDLRLVASLLRDVAAIANRA